MALPEVGRIVTMRARPGMVDRLAEAMSTVAQNMQGVPGCVLYAAGRDGVEENTVRIMEIWTDQASSDTALAATPDGDFSVADVLEMLADRPHVVPFTPLGGAGAPE